MRSYLKQSISCRLPRKIATLLTVLCAMTLANCASMMGLKGTTSPHRDQEAQQTDIRLALCTAFVPIGWVDGDTDETIQEVKEHNAAWIGLCSLNPQKEGNENEHQSP